MVVIKQSSASNMGKLLLLLIILVAVGQMTLRQCMCQRFLIWQHFSLLNPRIYKQ